MKLKIDSKFPPYYLANFHYIHCPTLSKWNYQAELKKQTDFAPANLFSTDVMHCHERINIIAFIKANAVLKT